ncbi:single-stranded DNA-binding protein [Mycetocola zhujimingii]|uniref:Single-stranded DNA-binding protein n=1 Tax=Mycetocola zhujimingii TaxID=2079792 RepID=A0A2U1THB4_9MICO|nr:single-stranded DNA-binding protein [Mycetocola zhujimingii]AWB86693.1 single-stranded DNA-binding protein [Mycetocola zhujimingii]PWC08230.1 single-stranded DNA-binding protein [Mycetocola zhujimingii]
MTDSISLTGLVATVPEHKTIRDGVELTSFRLASNQRYFDRTAGAWVAGETNWYTVSSFRQLAGNVHESVHKGDRVLVMGRLRIRRWESGDKNGTTVEVDADSVGHDLTWGTARYARTPARDSGTPAADAVGDEQRGYPTARQPGDDDPEHSASAAQEPDFAGTRTGSSREQADWITPVLGRTAESVTEFGRTAESRPLSESDTPF